MYLYDSEGKVEECEEVTRTLSSAEHTQMPFNFKAATDKLYTIIAHAGLLPNGCKANLEKYNALRKSLIAEIDNEAMEGDRSAQYFKGLINLQSCNNYAEGEKWLLKAAAQDLVEAKLALGDFYYIGFSGEPNFKEAMKWYIEVSNTPNGDIPHAERMVAQMYYYGLGTPQDYHRAMEWYLKAPYNGLAQGMVAQMYYYGEGVSQDYDKAFSLYYASAENGYAISQAMLGEMYLAGQGNPHVTRVEKYHLAGLTIKERIIIALATEAVKHLGASRPNKIEAAKWFALASEGNAKPYTGKVPEALEWEKNVESSMNKEDAGKVMPEVNIWKVKHKDFYAVPVL